VRALNGPKQMQNGRTDGPGTEKAPTEPSGAKPSAEVQGRTELQTHAGPRVGVSGGTTASPGGTKPRSDAGDAPRRERSGSTGVSSGVSGPGGSTGHQQLGGGGKPGIERTGADQGGKPELSIVRRSKRLVSARPERRRHLHRHNRDVESQLVSRRWPISSEAERLVHMSVAKDALIDLTRVYQDKKHCLPCNPRACRVSNRRCHPP